MGWKNLGEKPVVHTPWFQLNLADSVNHIYWTDQADDRGDPVAAFESEQIEWVALGQVPALITEGRIRAAGIAAALLLLEQRNGRG